VEPLLELPESIEPPEDVEPDEEDEPDEELPDDELPPPPRGAADPELEPVVFGREPACAHTAGATLNVNAAATMPTVSF